MKIKKEYERWLANAVADTDVAAELKAMDYVEVEDAFYRDLAFGTGGLRGVIGAGTNRMNIYTVAKASQGLADYLKKHVEEPSVAIGYDSRIKSDVLKFLLEDNCSLVVRPSGTEPKLKIYISVSAENKEMAEEVEDEIAKTAEKWIC